MKWQEYQDATGELYMQMEGFGNVKKNITLPDKITGRLRQIDVWIEIEAKSHTIGILVDAKFRKEKLDVKDVEEVLSLANAVGANKAVIVASSGWTKPAEIKARHIGLDLRLWTLEDALNLMVADKWVMCPICENDCIVLDRSGGIIIDGVLTLLSAGQCRECSAGLAWCWACGGRILLEVGQFAECVCGYQWKCKGDEIYINVHGSNGWALIPENQKSEFELGSRDRSQSDSDARPGEREDPESSIDEISKSGNSGPRSAQVYYEQARANDELGNLDLAIRDYSRTIDLDPLHAMAYGSRGIAYFASGDLEKAVVDLEQYLAFWPNSRNREMVIEAIERAKSTLDSNSGDNKAGS